MENDKFQKSSYSYDLPEELIAQFPMEPRDASRMMCLQRKEKTIEHRTFSELPDLLGKNSLVVVNNTKVIPARLPGQRKSGGILELLLVEELQPNRWRCKLKKSGKLREGEWLDLCDGQISAKFIAREEQGTSIVEFDTGDELLHRLEQFAFAPIPPYIHKTRQQERERTSDLKHYQTVFASQAGAIAAPTAGLHFSETILKELEKRKIEVTAITLHVGLGTFEPIKTEDIRQHKMHCERYEISKCVAEKIKEAKKEGRKIVAVGTTTLRALESAMQEGELKTGLQKTEIFIYPPYRFKIVDELITNFHLPESTLLMLVSAFAGRDFTLEAYREAVKEKYRFFSYGDAMYIQ